MTHGAFENIESKIIHYKSLIFYHCLIAARNFDWFNWIAFVQYLGIVGEQESMELSSWVVGMMIFSL